MKKSLLDKIIVNLDGQRFLLRGRTCEPLVNLDDVKGNKWVIADFRGSPSFLMAVESPPRYAELMAHRQLQERGEVGQNDKIITHWKQRRGSTLTEIFLTSVPREAFTSFLDYAKADLSHHLIFPLNALLYDVLSRTPRKKTVAVLFDHDRHVDIVFGQAGRVIANTRISTHSSDPAEKGNNMAEALAEELRSMASTGRVRLEEIVYFNWLLAEDSGGGGGGGSGDGLTFGTGGDATMATWGPGMQGSEDDKTFSSTSLTGKSTGHSSQLANTLMAADWVRKLAETLDVKCNILKPQRFDLPDNRILVTSLPEVLSQLDHARAANPALELYQYSASRNIKWALLAFWLLIAGFLVAMLWWNRGSSRLETEVRALESKDIVVNAPPPLEESRVEAVNFNKKLANLLDMPSPRAVMVEINNSIRGECHFKTVLFEYDPAKIPIITLTGRIGGGFEVAKGNYHEFTNNLRGLGYRVLDEDLTTNVQQIDFMVKLMRDDTKPKSFVVLIQSEDGTTGKVRISNQAGAQELAKAGQAVGMDNEDAKPTLPYQMDSQEIKSVFGKVMEAKPAAPVNFIFYFKEGSTTLTDASKAQLPDILGVIVKRTAPNVKIVGHTDRAGSNDVNWKLALDRANIVRDLVVEIGVAKESIETTSHGEGNPLIKTADGVAEPKNRRVEITVQ
ncbi:MAG: OmpA family protein [Magnetococcales bacterium]|nr:OmpA family protein [Magnetococcales bacterium]